MSVCMCVYAVYHNAQLNKNRTGCQDSNELQVKYIGPVLWKAVGTQVRVFFVHVCVLACVLSSLFCAVRQRVGGVDVCCWCAI